MSTNYLVDCTITMGDEVSGSSHVWRGSVSGVGKAVSHVRVVTVAGSEHQVALVPPMSTIRAVVVSAARENTNLLQVFMPLETSIGDDGARVVLEPGKFMFLPYSNFLGEDPFIYFSSSDGGSGDVADVWLLGTDA